MSNCFIILSISKVIQSYFFYCLQELHEKDIKNMFV